MGSFRRLIVFLQYCLCGIPVVLSVLAVRGTSLWLAAAAIAALLLVLWAVPICWGRQSVFGFLLCAAMAIPLNFRMIVFLWEADFFAGTILLSGVLWTVLLFVILLSIEEIMLGILVRVLWPRQYRTRVSKESDQ